MQSKLQTKLLLRKIAASRGRFIAIVLIILLGVLLFVGIKSAGPDLYKNARIYLNTQHASDVQLVSTAGLTTKDEELAQRVQGAVVEAEKIVTTVDTDSKHLLQFYSYSADQRLNQLRLTKGRLPRSANEVVVDDLAREEKEYRIGETVKVQTDLLKKQSYKIVGFVTSPQFVNKHSRPSSSQGTVDYFAYLRQNNFTQREPSQISFRFNRLAALNPFKDDYQTQVAQETKKIKQVFSGRAEARQDSLLKKIAAQLNQIEQSQKQLTAAKAQITATSGGRQSTTPELTAQQQQLDRAFSQLNANKQSLTDHPVQYQLNDRAALSGYSAYGDLSEQISVIADVFPLFFFLIAILITFTTMTRMVEEERTQIGTLKALGYHRREIERNYVFYALIAAVIGIVLGSVIGITTLPKIVTRMMANMFVFKETTVTFEWLTILLAVLLALFATLGAVLLVTYRELREKPANLMLAKTPKAGKRILLERIKPLWSRLSFNRKVSYRNLFRFKSRMWMGIVGIAGGAGLILTGFGIRDSIAETSVRQFDQVISYRAIAAITENTDRDKLASILAKETKHESHLPVHSESVTIKNKKQTLESVNVMVPTAKADFDRYLQVNAKLTNEGVLLSQKAASLLHVKPGDTFNVVKVDDQAVRVKVAAVAENYVGHFMYMTPSYYERVMKSKPTVNSWLLKYDQLSANQEEKLGNKLLEDAQVVNVSFVREQKKVLDDQIANLGPIVAVFILLSGLLTFVVLYNLTNINISERIRELSTIKVLGFFDREVTMYIVRENIVLTIFGIILGVAFGNGLLWFILRQAMTDEVIFPLTIGVVGYVTSILLTIVFTIIVMLVTHRKLKGIDMIDALKSNE